MGDIMRPIPFEELLTRIFAYLMNTNNNAQSLVFPSNSFTHL